jgi:diguanylate cyclase (GGDEF)-like protein/PAS domain S-box-containing protein
VDTVEEEYEALLQFLYLVPVGIVQFAPDGTVGMMNPLCAQLLMPLSPDGALDNLFDALEQVAPELRHMVSTFTAAHGSICDSQRVQVSAGIPGKLDARMLSVSLLKLDAKRIMAVISDVSEVVRRERQLKQSEAWFNALMNGVTDYALMSLDAGGRVQDWNQSIARVTGHAARDVAGREFSFFYPPGAITSDRIADRLREADANGWSLDNGWCVRADGSRFWANTMIAPLARGTDVPLSDQGYALIVRDISDKREAGDSALRASACDFLTGIANRRTFFEAAELELERWHRFPRPLSLITIDADFFKKVNDTWGHAAGDEVLRNLAATLAANVREIDVVARLGGEEFAALLPSTDLDGAIRLAERCRTAVESQRVQSGDAEISYTVSIGVASMEAGVSGVDQLLKLADGALYAAKRAGRNRVWHERAVHDLTAPLAGLEGAAGER